MEGRGGRGEGRKKGTHVKEGGREGERGGGEKKTREGGGRKGGGEGGGGGR